MSVLIKGLEMPEDGALLCLKIYPNGVVRICFSPPQPPDSKIATAIPISDHGDLIDRDALIDVLHHGSKNISEIQKGVKDEKTISYCQGIMVGYANSRIALDGAPVVIPAERSEE